MEDRIEGAELPSLIGRVGRNGLESQPTYETSVFGAGRYRIGQDRNKKW